MESTYLWFWIVQWLNDYSQDEFYTILVGVIQRHYLIASDGAFSENFYSLKRMKLNRDGTLTGLTPQQRFLSWISLAFTPYAFTKLCKLHASTDQGTPSSPVWKLIKVAFLKLFPMTIAAHDMWFFVLQLQFMFNRSRFYSPLLWWQGITLERITSDDMRKQMLTEQLNSHNQGLFSKATSKLFTMLRLSLIASALVFKIAEWYYSPENQSQREQIIGPSFVPAPPMAPIPHPNIFGVHLPKDPSNCPLCGEKRKNPAASSSGVMYCYICIHNFISDHGQCPVTGMRCQTSEIRRIFLS